jgi:hypothetical protein
VLSELKSLARKGKLVDSVVRKKNPPLYGAAIRLFGSFSKARKAAGAK